MTETQVDNAQVGAEQNVPAANGTQNGSQEVADLKDILGPVFGTTFKSDEDALNSVIAAKNMSGKVGQLEKQVTELQTKNMNPELEKQVAELSQTVKSQTFFTQHPEYDKPEIKALITDMGGDAEAVTQKDSFKTAFEAIKSRDDIDKSKSVLHTNPRLGAATDNMTKAQDALKSGDTYAAGAAATLGVLDAYNMKQSENPY